MSDYPTNGPTPCQDAYQAQQRAAYPTGGACAPGSLGGPCRTETAPGSPRASDQYAQAKEAHYSGSLFEQLHARRRVLEARRDNAVQQLNMVHELLKVLVD